MFRQEFMSAKSVDASAPPCAAFVLYHDCWFFKPWEQLVVRKIRKQLPPLPRSSPRGPSVRGKTDSLSDQMLTDGEAIRPGQVCHQGFRREKNEVNYWFKPKRVSNVQLRKDSCPFQVRWSFRNFLFKVNLKLYTCFKKRYHFDEFYFTGLDFF